MALTGEVDVYTGHRAIDGAILDTEPEKHTLHCLRDIEKCRKNGYAVLKELDDGWYSRLSGNKESCFCHLSLFF